MRRSLCVDQRSTSPAPSQRICQPSRSRFSCRRNSGGTEWAQGRTIDAFLDASHLLSLALLLAFRRAQLPYALLLLALQLRIDSLPTANTNAVHRGGSGGRRCADGRLRLRRGGPTPALLLGLLRLVPLLRPHPVLLRPGGRVRRIRAPLPCLVLSLRRLVLLPLLRHPTLELPLVLGLLPLKLRLALLLRAVALLLLLRLAFPVRKHQQP